MYLDVLQLIAFIILAIAVVKNYSYIVRVIMLLVIVIAISVRGYSCGNTGYSVFYLIVSMNVVLMILSLTLATEINDNGKITSNKKYFIDLLFFVLCLFCGYFITHLLASSINASRSMEVVQSSSSLSSSTLYLLYIVLTTLSFIMFYFVKADRGDK